VLRECRAFRRLSTRTFSLRRLVRKREHGVDEPPARNPTSDPSSPTDGSECRRRAQVVMLRSSRPAPKLDYSDSKNGELLRVFAT